MNEPILVAALRALEPVLNEVALIGGTAFRLLKRTPGCVRKVLSD